MKIRYAKRFSKDIDSIEHDAKLKKRLLLVLEKLQQMNSLVEMNDVRKIQGYEGY